MNDCKWCHKKHDAGLSCQPHDLLNRIAELEQKNLELAQQESRQAEVEQLQARLDAVANVRRVTVDIHQKWGTHGKATVVFAEELEVALSGKVEGE